MNKSLACILLLLFCSAGFSQHKPPKIGLCLSGGGAKGLAHIGLLKVIDSAGVKIDCITGTSMGAIVGGMYSIGYSGNELERIARRADWELLLSNTVPLTDINIEEKDEFGRYRAELPMNGLKPTLPLGAIDGPWLTILLNELTFPVHQITKFDSLPIPFHCIGADIITGEAVVLTEGYLPTAMRASMSIPSVFTPVKWKNHLLVDGGLVRNFPVTDVRAMGATIIIGGYTGGRLYTEEELTSPIKMIYQSASFNRVADSEFQKGLCTLLADYDAELQNYSAVSFNKADSIIDIGYRIALKLYPRLKRLADSLDMAGRKKQDSLERYFRQDVYITKITLDGASGQSYDLARGKLGLKENRNYKVSDINRAINMVYGTRFFDKVYYTLEVVPNGYELLVHLVESRRAAFKFALHYDNEQAAGILLNLTVRNLLGKGSRALITADVSEFPKVRVNYQKFINKRQNIWVQGGYHYEFVPYRLYNYGRLQEELTNSYSNTNIGINYTLGKNSYVGGAINYETNFTRTKIYPEDQAKPDSFSLRNLTSQELGVGVKYMFNTFNRFLFPTKGCRVFLYGRYIPWHNYVNNYYILDFNSQYETQSTVSPALKLSLSVVNVTPVNQKISWINTGFVGFIQDIRFKGWANERYSEGAQSGFFYAGGVEQRQRPNYIPFIGYRETELVSPQLLVWTTALQSELLNKLFVTPSLSFMAAGQNIEKFLLNIARPNFVYQDFSKGATHAIGYGITFAYNWFGGPISFTVYRATGVKVTRGYLTFGFKF